ncbi:DmsC/YnfH family molybdoenzyme membrane anchor subunit [Escherichia coli]
MALLKGDLRAEAQQRVIACMFGLWVLMGIGFIASMLHLGSPMRAFNSLNRVGLQHSVTKSPAVPIFFAVGGIGWLLAMLKAVTGIAYAMAGGDDGSWRRLVWMMVRVYNSIDTVRPGTASGRRWASS